MNIEELHKLIAVKKMDLEECEHELHHRYYPSVVRIAMTNYISALQDQLETYHNDLNNRSSVQNP